MEWFWADNHNTRLRAVVNRGIRDFFRTSTALEHRFVEPVLESSCTDVYTAVLRAVSPRAALTAASFARSLLFSTGKGQVYLK